MLWPVHLKPRPDEVTSSWIVRLAIGHGYTPNLFCRGVWGKKNIWNRDIDKFPIEGMFPTLSEKTGTPMDAVLGTHLSSYEGRLYREHHPRGSIPWIMPIGVYHRLRESYGQQFCPHCLAEEIYLKKQWRLALVTCCTKHGTILLDRCPECQSPVHFYRDDICPATCFNCKFDLRAATTVAATPEMLAAQSKWLSGIEEGVAIGEASGPDYFDVLRHLTALMLSKYAFCRDIGHHTAAAIGIPWDQPRRSINSGMESLGITDRIKLLQMANWLLDEWPKRFINFCQGHKIWSAALTKELPNAPAWYKGIVDKHLKKGSRKGTHGPPSKQARNWKPIQTIPRSRKTNRQALATTQSVVSSKYAAQSNLS